MFQYYVQVIANNYLKNLVDPPEQMTVHKSFLYGAEEEDFQNGFLELLSTIRLMYSDITKSPNEFEMLLKENVIPDARNTDYTQSHASFTRLPHVLLVLGYKGELQPDMTISISGNDLLKSAKDVKITKTQFLLKKLEEYGFEIDGMSKALQAGDRISVSYPQNRFLITALKSMSEAMGAVSKGDLRKSKNLFYMMNYRILQNEKPKEPKLTVDYIYHALADDKRRIAKNLNNFIEKYAKPSVRMGGFMRNDWSCVYHLLSNKKVLLTLNVGQEDFSVKLNLANISQYTDIIKKYPDEIRESIKSSGWECGNCHGNCAGGFAFSLDGKSYNKCRCGSFVFNYVNDDTVRYCTELLEQEIKAEA